MGARRSEQARQRGGLSDRLSVFVHPVCCERCRKLEVSFTLFSLFDLLRAEILLPNFREPSGGEENIVQGVYPLVELWIAVDVFTEGEAEPVVPLARRVFFGRHGLIREKLFRIPDSIRWRRRILAEMFVHSYSFSCSDGYHAL